MEQLKERLNDIAIRMLRGEPVTEQEQKLFQENISKDFDQIEELEYGELDEKEEKDEVEVKKEQYEKDKELKLSPLRPPTQWGYRRGESATSEFLIPLPKLQLGDFKPKQTETIGKEDLKEEEPSCSKPQERRVFFAGR